MIYLNKKLKKITDNIIKRSKKNRTKYLQYIDNIKNKNHFRFSLSCSNFAHSLSGLNLSEKNNFKNKNIPNIGIISSYNEVLSAHTPYKDFPTIIKKTTNKIGGIAQFASGIPAMCDGITQGNNGMELSLFSREIIAMSTIIALSHNIFDAIIFLGVCDKIVPGLLIGALKFGYLPSIFIPSGPMKTGLSNKEKIKKRQQFYEKKCTYNELLKYEILSYNNHGTCTFYGTANSNQMLMEFMGLHIPGSSFINPYTKLRKKLTQQATICALNLTKKNGNHMPIGYMINEKTIVNGIVGLLATGGSTNHTLHIIAIAKAAGILINLNDFNKLSKITPLLVKIYPNGNHDINKFNESGGIQYLINELLNEGLLHDDVQTVIGPGLRNYIKTPYILKNKLIWKYNKKIKNKDIIRNIKNPFQYNGGLKVMKGKLGIGIMKISSIKKKNFIIKAPAIVFNSQQDIQNSFNRNELECNFIAVIRFQGICSNGMPELHNLTTILSTIQKKGFSVGLITDGRMSGASGKIPSVIHISPEAILNGPISKIKNGDILTINAESGEFNIEIEESKWAIRKTKKYNFKNKIYNFSQDLFKIFKLFSSSSDEGSSILD